MSRDLGLSGDAGFTLQDAHFEVDQIEYRLHPTSEPHHRAGYLRAPQEGTIEEETAGFAVGEAGESLPPISPALPGVPPRRSIEEYRARYKERVHRLPADAGFRDYLMFLPRAIYRFVDRLCDAFGFKFVALLMSVYGLSQGLGESYMAMSSDYYLKDILKLEPASAQAFKSLMHLPWNIKPIYGLISDTLPIFGYHRGPYIFLAGAFGVFAWITLALQRKASFGLAAFLLLLANYSIASPDVIIDAAVTERSQYAPMYASDLQSLSWGSHAMGGIIGCTTVGQAQAHIHSRGVFALTSLTALSIMVLAAMRWLPEKQIPPGAERSRACRHAWVKGGQRSLYLLAFFVAACAVFLATTVNHVEDRMIAGYITVAVAVLVTIVVYMVLVKISPKIAKPAIFFFLREACQPNIAEAMFYFYTSDPNGPLFTPQFLGVLSCIGSVSMMIGIAMYNRYMSSWKYRTIFIAAQVLMVGAGMLDWILVKRLNLRVGISDKAFVLGDEALVPILRRFSAMPFFVLAAKVCPERCEATLFALLMALSNFGGDVGSYIGVGVLKAFHVHRGDYSELSNVVLVKTMCRFIPVFLIPLLIPDASPADEILTEKEKMMRTWEEEGGGEEEEQGGRGEGGGIEMSGGKGGVEGGVEGRSPARRRRGSGTSANGGDAEGLMGGDGGEGGRKGGVGLQRQTSDLDRLGSPEEIQKSCKL
ncbi:major facilitator superfamily protein isoform 2 [Nannochloropsis oceanica]